MSTADRAIRVSTAVAVLGVAGIAAYVSYWYAYEVVRAHGEDGVTARLEPATIDGLVYASSMFSGGPLPVVRRCTRRLAEGFCSTAREVWCSLSLLLRSPARADPPRAQHLMRRQPVT